MLNTAPYLPRSAVPIKAAIPVINNYVLTAASVSVAPARFDAGAGRYRLIICNHSVANLLTFNFGNAAVISQAGITLGFLAAAGGLHIWDSNGGPCPADEIFMIGTAGQRATIIEYLAS